MKIEITDKELEAYRTAIEMNKYISSGIYGGPDNTGSYSINFDVFDGEKASYFFQTLIYDKELTKYLEEKAGFRITSLNLYQSKNIDPIIEELQSLINRIKNL